MFSSDESLRTNGMKMLDKNSFVVSFAIPRKFCIKNNNKVYSIETAYCLFASLKAPRKLY